jgi:hypothetical protein
VPDGQITSSYQKSCQAPPAKIFLFRFSEIHDYPLPIPPPQEGRIAIVTDVGSGMRWTRRCFSALARRRGHRLGRPSRVVLSPPDAGVKPCEMIPRRWWLTSPVHQGERGAAVKTIVQGMPVDPAQPVVTAACFFCCRRAMGEAITRHSLRPLRISRAELPASSGRECAAGA